MNVYVRVLNDRVFEVIYADRDINTLFHPDFVKLLVDVSAVAPTPDQGWGAVESDGVWAFTAPESIL